MGVALPVLDIFAHFLLQIWLKFPFRPWTIHVVCVVKKLNWLIKFIQVEVAVKCMRTKFTGHGLSIFFVCFKNSQISLLDHGLKSMRSKNRISSKNSCK